MNHQITTILFDADGVLQHPSINYHLEVSKLLGHQKDETERFLSELFVVERNSLSGKSDFQKDLLDMLTRLDLRQYLNDVLNISKKIKPSIPILTLISKLRSNGLFCCLASNQQAYRAHYMSHELGYSKHFDKEFYSCHLGFSKPDSNFFKSIIEDVGCTPNQILFIDDQESNVLAARDFGIHSEIFSSTADRSDQLLNEVIAKYTNLNINL